MSRRHKSWLIAVGMLIAFARPAVAGEPVTLTADQAVQLAIARHPELASLGGEARAAAARWRGASLLLQANPQVAAAVGPHTGNGGAQLDYEVSIAQQLELFGQRGARIDATRSGKLIADARLQARRAAMAAEVRQAFVRALGSEQHLSLARESLALSRQTVQAAQRRFELGDGSRIEVNTAKIDVARSTRDVNSAVRDRAGAYSELSALVALDATTQLHLDGALTGDSPAVAADAAALERLALESRADLVAARGALQAAQAERRLASREALPRPQVGARYERDQGDHVVMGTLQMELPAFNRNEAGRGVAEAQAMQAEVTLQAMDRQIRREVQLAVLRLRAAREAVGAFETDVVAAIEENLALVVTAYEAGKLDLLELLLVRRNAIEARRGYIEALEELRTAETELAKALGAKDGRL